MGMNAWLTNAETCLSQWIWVCLEGDLWRFNKIVTCDCCLQEGAWKMQQFIFCCIHIFGCRSSGKQDIWWTILAHKKELSYWSFWKDAKRTLNTSWINYLYLVAFWIKRWYLNKKRKDNYLFQKGMLVTPLFLWPVLRTWQKWKKPSWRGHFRGGSGCVLWARVLPVLHWVAPSLPLYTAWD